MVTERDERWGRVIYDPSSDEFEAHIDGLAKDTPISRPLSAGCIVTGKCNLRCGFCYGNIEALPAKELAANQWWHIFRHLREWGLMRVDLSGGEPTLRRDLPDIVRAALDNGLNVVISSNGIPLAERGIDNFPPARWHVSLDSGFAEVHESSRALQNLLPSNRSFERASKFLMRCCEKGNPVRVLTCIGGHNRDCLFSLGEHLAALGVTEWNISRILRAGRAQADYERRWSVTEVAILEQVGNLRHAFPFIRIRYSNRTEQDGYFLLVLPDGSLATQYTDGRDKVILGDVLSTSLQQLRANPEFDLAKHGRKWIAATLGWQPYYALVAALPSVTASQT